MKTIEKGVLVKAWDVKKEEFVIGEYEEYVEDCDFPHHVKHTLATDVFRYAVIVPSDLATQLTRLSNE